VLSWLVVMRCAVSLGTGDCTTVDGQLPTWAREKKSDDWETKFRVIVSVKVSVRFRNRYFCHPVGLLPNRKSSVTWLACSPDGWRPVMNT